jgi:hypothetical protein
VKVTAGIFRDIQLAVLSAVAWGAVGFATARWLEPGVSPSLPPAPQPPPVVQPAPVPAPVPAPTPPAPAPSPVPVGPAAVKHTGRLTVSWINSRYPTPAQAAIRDDLASVDWKAHDAMFRSYVDGQEELKSLGFAGLYKPDDLPIVFVQETQNGKAPLIGEPIRSPASAGAVLAHVKGLRGE